MYAFEPRVIPTIQIEDMTGPSVETAGLALHEYCHPHTVHTTRVLGASKATYNLE